MVLRSIFQGIAEIGTGVGYACGPVIGGFLYKVVPAIEDYYAINSWLQFSLSIHRLVATDYLSFLSVVFTLFSQFQSSLY